MRIQLSTLLLLFIFFPLSAQRLVELDEVSITAERLLSNIGIQKTVLDSVSLRQNITQNLGDVLSQHSTIFIKSYGRATLSTASFRGTAPSHTQVTWNDIKLNSPMLGQVDFSLIPSYFIDKASLYHGASSTGVTGGGLGGAVTLGTQATGEKGLGLKYIQGISSYQTFDEFLRINYGSKNWESSTRFLYSSSKNDFKYINYRKKEYTTDTDGNLTSTYPEERNKNGDFNDLHLMQELYYNAPSGNRFGIYGWYLNSRRGIPMLNVDYKEESESKNEQKEQTLRTGANWEKRQEQLKMAASVGYTYTDLNYTYKADIGTGELSEMIHSRSYVHSASGKIGGEYSLHEKWMIAVNLSGYQHYVNSMDRAILTMGGEKATVGYKKSRTEISGFASVRYTPFERLGLAVNLREEYYGGDFTPIIPAGFVDFLVSRKGNVLVKASIARNYRYPTLNDLYFMPGGNDTLKTEKGYTYDGGVEFTLKNQKYRFKGEVTAYNSYIHDWIVWLPTFKGFWTPENIKKVHSYGVEMKGTLTVKPATNWLIEANGNYAITHSINQGDPISWADESIGKQLVYIPRNSSAVTGRVSWKEWRFSWLWNYYGERFTTSSNEKATKIGQLKPYYMNTISLEKECQSRWVLLSLKLTVNNLFDEGYESVLSRPMAGRNIGFFIGITPLFK